jgi:hypothetical protein
VGDFMSLSRKKLTQYHKQCEFLENFYKNTNSNKSKASQISKQKKEAAKLLKKIKVGS